MRCEEKILQFLEVIEKVANKEFMKDNWRGILDKIASLFDADVAAIGELRDGYVYYSRVSGTTYRIIPWYNPEEFKVPLERSATRELINKDIVKIDDYQKYENAYEKLKELGIRSVLMASLRDSQIFGCLAIVRFGEKRPFDDYDVRVLRSLAFVLTSIIKEDIEKRALLEKAIKDPLTKLYNRYFFEEEVKNELEKARRYEYPVSVILFDIDEFKKVNDTYGHLVGDEVLKKFAEILRTNTRSTDIAVRYGGEEFILLLPYTSLDEAKKVAERIRKIFKSEVFKTDRGNFSLTVSAGVVCCENGQCSLRELLENVDRAMYEAKRQGKDRVVAYRHTHIACR